jgi:hypothetical protein
MNLSVSTNVKNQALLDINPMTNYQPTKANSRYTSITSEELADKAPMFRLNHNLTNSQKELHIT